MNAVSSSKIQFLKPHISLNVHDVKASIEFYKKMFGIEPAKVRAGYAKFDLFDPPLNFTLNETGNREKGSLSHLGLQVASTEDVVAMRQKWIDAGLDTRDEMQTTCCYALQDKTWINDPDGNEWEVFVVLDDASQATTEKTDREAGCCSPAQIKISSIKNESKAACC